MVGILAFIGFAVILWWLSKSFTNLGNFLNKLGDTMAENSVKHEQSGAAVSKALDDIKKAKKLKEKTSVISNAEYTVAVRDEINKLTNGSL